MGNIAQALKTRKTFWQVALSFLLFLPSCSSIDPSILIIENDLATPEPPELSTLPLPDSRDENSNTRLHPLEIPAGLTPTPTFTKTVSPSPTPAKRQIHKLSRPEPRTLTPTATATASPTLTSTPTTTPTPTPTRFFYLTICNGNTDGYFLVELSRYPAYDTVLMVLPGKCNATLLRRGHYEVYLKPCREHTSIDLDRHLRFYWLCNPSNPF